MTIREWSVAGGALLFTLGAGCAGMGERSGSTNPTTQRVESSQQQSQLALNRANDAQKKASDQARRVADAQNDVQKAQQQLTQSQQRLRDEQEKAVQLQREAQQATREAARQAGQAQEEALQGLHEQGQQIAQGQQVIQGQVTAAAGDQLSVRPQGGHSMTFQVTDRTHITVDGRSATLEDIRQGQDARVGYELSGTTPTALSVAIGRRGAADGRGSSEPSSTGAPSQPGSGTQQDGGPASNPSQQPPGGRY